MNFVNDPRLKRPEGTGQKYQVIAEYANVFTSDDPDSTIATQVLFGETVMAYRTSANLYQVQLSRDDYVGWVDQVALSQTINEPNSKITARLAVAYKHPDLKSRPLKSLSLGALADIGAKENDFGFCAEAGWISDRHYTQRDSYSNDPVSVAKKFMDAPYQWGGRDSRGIDCSGLVQQAFESCNALFPRDTDMQFASGNRTMDWTDSIKLERNDLIFWKGHVAIVIDTTSMIHASAKHMAVVQESITAAVPRMSVSTGLPVGVIRHRFR